MFQRSVLKSRFVERHDFVRAHHRTEVLRSEGLARNGVDALQQHRRSRTPA
jgi:hypothetical protein